MVDMKLSVIPMSVMKKNAGMAESGIAMAEMTVARMSRRNRSTTRTARTAPSIRPSIADEYWAFV